MKKFVILALATISLAACGKGGAHSQFVKMCNEDPRAKEQGFNCECQADIIAAVLKQDEMDKLVNFLNVEKQDQSKALELGKDPAYTPMFQKIASIGFAIHDKCANPNAQPAAPAAASQPAPATSSAPAASKPAAAAPAAKAPAKAAAPAEEELPE